MGRTVASRQLEAAMKADPDTSVGTNVTALVRASRHFGAVNQPTIQRILKGGSNEPRPSTLRPVAQYYGIDVQLFFVDNQDLIARAVRNKSGTITASTFGNNSSEISHNEARKKEQNTGEIIKNMVPIVGNTQAGPDKHWDDLGYPVGNGDGYIDIRSTDPNAYGLKVVGTSMHPRMREGEVIMVSPNSEAYPGDEVVVKMLSGEVMVKELVSIRGNQVTLDSISSDHKRIVRSTEEIQYIHLVTGVFRAGSIKHE